MEVTPTDQTYCLQSLYDVRRDGLYLHIRQQKRKFFLSAVCITLNAAISNKLKELLLVSTALDIILHAYAKHACVCRKIET